MHDLELLDAMNQSQDGKPLVHRMSRLPQPAVDGSGLDLLSDLLIHAYRRADCREDVLNDLLYYRREIQRAIDAVKALEVANA